MVGGAVSADDQGAESGWVGVGGLSDGDCAALDAAGARLGGVERRRGLATTVLVWLLQ